MKRYFLKVSGLVLVFGAFSIVGPAMAQQSPNQIVTGVPSSQTAGVGQAVAITAQYNVSDGDNTLTGLGVRVHFNSARLTWTGNSSVFSNGLTGCGAPQNDTGNFDGDPATDRFVLCAWFDLGGNWPNQPLPLDLITVNFTSNLAASQDTTVRFTTSSTATGYGFVGNPATVSGGQQPPPPAAVQQIPVLSPFGIAALALLLGGMPFVFRRRK